MTIPFAQARVSHEWGARLMHSRQCGDRADPGGCGAG